MHKEVLGLLTTAMFSQLGGSQQPLLLMVELTALDGFLGQQEEAVHMSLLNTTCLLATAALLRAPPHTGVASRHHSRVHPKSATCKT